MTRPSYLLWTPGLRSAHLERLAGDVLPGWDLTLAATGRTDDCDDALLAATSLRVEVGDLPGLVRGVAAAPPTVLEVTEPSWGAQWPAAQALIEAAAGRSRVVSYAIDELVEDGPLPDAGAVDAVVFGTRASARAYAGAWPAAGWRSSVLEERREPCAGCYTAGQAAPAEREVVVVAELAQRKGTDVLMAAWDLLARSEAAAGWRVRLLGGGRLLASARAWSAGRADVEVLGPVGRVVVHAALRRAAVVALPSRRVPGWREQVGLSLVEGLAHGCAVVTTTETGLAEGLAAEGHPVVAPEDPPALAAGLAAALASYRPEKVLPAAGTDSRVRATRWLAGIG